MVVKSDYDSDTTSATTCGCIHSSWTYILYSLEQAPGTEAHFSSEAALSTWWYPQRTDFPIPDSGRGNRPASRRLQQSRKTAYSASSCWGTGLPTTRPPHCLTETMVGPRGSRPDAEVARARSTKANERIGRSVLSRRYPNLTPGIPTNSN